VLAAAQTALLTGLPGAAQAEKAGTDIAKQVSIASLPLIIMERDSLTEKHAREAGLPEVKVHGSTAALTFPSRTQAPGPSWPDATPLFSSIVLIREPALGLRLDLQLT